MPRVFKRAKAQQDLVECYVYLAENASLNIADRFLVNSEASFVDLSEQPFMGSPLTLRNPKLADIRKWRVKEFDDILIFYLPRHDGVSIVRVLHAAQDWWKLLDMKP
jgi:toxin ParE1/3/4